MKREVRLEGRHGYVCRRVLFKGLRVALLMGHLDNCKELVEIRDRHGHGYDLGTGFC